MGRRRCAIVGAVVLLGAVCPGAARATRYHVYACHTPGGGFAPIDGWTAASTGPGGRAFDNCVGPTTYALTAAVDGPSARTGGASSAAWSFATGPDLTLAGGTIFRHEGLAGGGGSYATVLASVDLGDNSIRAIDSCQGDLGCSGRGTNNGGFDPSNRVTVPAGGSGGTLLLLEAFCPAAGAGSCATSAGGYAAEADLYAADLVLDDAAGPAVDNLGGTLVGGGTLTGPADIRLGATDGGSGVYSAQVRVDGKAVVSQVLDTNAGRCVPAGLTGDGTRDFLYQQPCVRGTHADVSFDTGTIKDGSHTLAVSVDDAAGNASAVFTGQVTTRNAPQGGVPQITGVLQHGQRLTANPGSWSPTPASFNYQWLRCSSGQSSCQPIPGAVGQVYVPATADDYQSLALDLTATDAAGSTTARTALVGPVADLAGATSAGVQALSGGLTGAHAKGSPSTTAVGGPGAGGAAHTPNGSGACAAAHLVAGFGTSAVVRLGLGGRSTLRGKLDCGGHPIGGAAIGVSIVRGEGRGATTSGPARTAADGTFAVPIGAGPSRRVTLTYRAFADDAAPSATAVARVEVKPTIALAISPTHVRNGQSITYRGQVFGGYIPAAGLPLDVEYRDGRRWRIFDTTRARAKDGRFSYRYTFRRTTVPIVYVFRVVIPASGASGYPYTPNASRARSVRVDP